MEQTICCGVRTVIVYGVTGPQSQSRSVHCPRGRGTMSLDHCECCAKRTETVANGDGARTHIVCRIDGEPSPRALMVSEIMPRKVVAVRPDLRADVVLLALVEHDRGGAPVVDHLGRPIGMVSATDLMRGYRSKSRVNRRPGGPAGDPLLVADVMSQGAFTISEDASVDEALDELERRNVKRLMVVGDREELVGIVTALDLLRAIPPPTRSRPAVIQVDSVRLRSSPAPSADRRPPAEAEALSA